MKCLMVMALLAAGTLNAHAESTCVGQAADKKLAGAAKTSFLTKCRKDAAASCDAAAGGKKLAGAAKTSFTKKCLTDAVGE